MNSPMLALDGSSSASSSTAGLTGRILVVDDHRSARESIADVLRQGGHHVDCRAAASEALEMLAGESYDVVITDLQMPGMDGLEFMRRLQRRPHGAQMLMITAHATIASAVEAMRLGAFNFIEKPFDVEQLERLVGGAMAHGQRLDQAGIRAHTAGAADDAAMIGTSGAMQTVRRQVAQAAPTPVTILITGESGTGKELVARSVHATSDRSQQPLVDLNCPVLAAQLLESELFGHERGAFTGADSKRTGRFELADGGTLLLDEVSEIDLGIQAKLLRVLQEGSFQRVGSSKTVHVDVRVLATTNRDLTQEVANGRFRDDLFYRLNVVPIHVPPLRERREDIPALIEHFLKRVAERLKKEACELTDAARDMLAAYHWPGNVRELENIVTRASVLNLGPPLGADDLRPWLIDAEGVPAAGIDIPVGLSLQEMEQKLIEATLDRYGGHRQNTAEALGIGLRTLSGKLKSYGFAPRARRRAA